MPSQKDLLLHILNVVLEIDPTEITMLIDKGIKGMDNLR